MTRRIVPDIIKDQKFLGISSSVSAREAAKLMSKHKFGALMVVKDDQLEGIISERDISNKIVAQGRDPDKTKVSQIMTKKPETVSPDDTAIKALERMHERGFRHLPVLDGETIIGIVSIRDLYAAAKDQLEDDLKDRDKFIFGTGYGC